MRPAAALWRLSHSWYLDRLSTHWAPRSLETSQRLLSAAGFDGPFFALNAADPPDTPPT